MGIIFLEEPFVSQFSERENYAELRPSPNSYVAAPTPNVTVFGDKVSKEAVKGK